MTAEFSKRAGESQYDFSLVDPRFVQAEARRRGLTQSSLASILKKTQASVSLAFAGELRHLLEAIARYLVGTGSDFWRLVPHERTRISNGVLNLPDACPLSKESSG